MVFKAELGSGGRGHVVIPAGAAVGGSGDLLVRSSSGGESLILSADSGCQ